MSKISIVFSNYPEKRASLCTTNTHSLMNMDGEELLLINMSFSGVLLIVNLLQLVKFRTKCHSSRYIYITILSLMGKKGFKDDSIIQNIFKSYNIFKNLRYTRYEILNLFIVFILNLYD